MGRAGNRATDRIIGTLSFYFFLPAENGPLGDFLPPFGGGTFIMVVLSGGAQGIRI